METKERKVAVAVDESEESMYALSWFLQNLVPDNHQNTLIFLIYARPPPAIYSPFDAAGDLFSSDVLATVEKYSKDLADSVMKRAKEVYQNFHNVKIEERIGSGDARDVICGLVDTLGVDVLVMGSHGYGFIQRALLGSVSDECAKKVKCPVLIVKRPKN
ncbi:universal stress protein PHOS32-like protein [Cinnamomum micranthum f. kanehirae]|uniref:Universal stress protein PHOS32-like protein n=1 Tax=Cinnamomum micranthum f. kanehirae TaxID=337451 RepID=A0A443PWS4_9MAGN|nr:universal stress protein PHOS32-like protein [Cinnamomum micranthum f. kanehirae]